MRITVILLNALAKFPPVVNLTSSLLRLGHEVTLIAYDLGEADSLLRGNSKYTPFNLGNQKSSVRRIRQDHESSKIIKQYLNSHKGAIDCVWTTTDATARDLGKTLLEHNHVMQMMELVEHVSIMTPRELPLHSKTVKVLARNARHVVVPEYNRACIQQVWWQLPAKPIVLPNKPQWDGVDLKEEAYPDTLSVFKNETRKILLYQGIFYKDRNFDPYVKAAELLDNEYVLCLMGKAWSQGEKAELERLTRQYGTFKYAGFVSPPGHLAFTHYGYIGLLPYQAPTEKTRYLKSSYLASINAIYCAPNKIWEYAFVNMPMLGSDVPGLRYPFEEYDMGMVSSADPEEIAEKIKAIDARHDEMGVNARRFYDSIDIDEIIASILE